MTPAQMFWIVIFLAMVLGVVAGHVVDQRRKQSLAEFEQNRKARKEEVERTARKAL